MADQIVLGMASFRENQVSCCSPVLVMSLDWYEANRVKWSTSPLLTMLVCITRIADNAVTFQR